MKAKEEIRKYKHFWAELAPGVLSNAIDSITTLTTQIKNANAQLQETNNTATYLAGSVVSTTSGFQQANIEQALNCTVVKESYDGYKVALCDDFQHGLV